MAYYNSFSKRPLSKKDHLKKDAAEWKKDEGSDYRGATGKRSALREKPDTGKGGRPGVNHDTRFAKGRPSRPQEMERGKRKPADLSTDPRPASPARESQPSRDFSAPRGPRVPAVRPASAPQERRFAQPAVPPAEIENLITGRNPIREALKSGRDIEKLLVAKGDLNGTAREIVAMAREQHIPVQTVERSRLDEICRGHQGMLAYASAYRYYEVEDMLADAESRGEKPFLVILDGVTDPMNLGAIIRTAACAGAHGVIVPQRRAVGLTPSAVKASAGAVEKIKVARVTNLSRTLEALKERGVWMYAADMNGTDYRKTDFSGAVGLVIGSEGEGVSRLTLESCDYRVSLPMTGAVDSLNASVAAGILMYAVMAAR